MQEKFIIDKAGLYVTEVLGFTDGALQFKTLRDESRALRFLDKSVADSNCPPGFKVSKYSPTYKALEAHIKTLEELLDTFIVHTNGISRHVRFPGYKARLLSDEKNKELVEDIQDLYSYQCTVEQKLQEY